MEIAFRTKALRTLCLGAPLIDARFGPECGATLRRLLADLRAAVCLGDVPLLVLKPSGGTMANETTIDVCAGVRMNLRANHRLPPMTPDGEINWFLIDRILIEQIVSAHD
jgi:hypothetical protein